MTQELAQEVQNNTNGTEQLEEIDVFEENFMDDGGGTLLDGLRRILMAGIGVVVLAQEEIEDFVNKLIDRGEIAEKDGRSLIADIFESQKKFVVDNTKRASTEADQRVENVMKRLNIPTVSEINRLSEKIDELSKKIDELQESSS